MSSGTAISDAEWARFQDEYTPFLEQVEADIASRRGDYVKRAVENVDRTTATQSATLKNRDASMGVARTAQQQEAQDKLLQLGASQSLTAAENQAIDTADEVNKNVANIVTNSQTQLINSAIADQEAGSGLASSREMQNANARQQHANNQAQMYGAGLTAIALMV